MFKSRLALSDHYKNKYSVSLSYVCHEKYGAKKDKDVARYKVRLINKNKPDEDKHVGDYMFELLLQRSKTRLCLLSIEPINLAALNYAHKELMFDLLLHVAKTKLLSIHDAKVLIVSSKDCFIQEAMIANGYRLQTKTDSKTKTKKFSGIWSPINIY